MYYAIFFPRPNFNTFWTVDEYVLIQEGDTLVVAANCDGILATVHILESVRTYGSTEDQGFYFWASGPGSLTDTER